jgi:hypothetical protein
MRLDPFRCVMASGLAWCPPRRKAFGLKREWARADRKTAPLTQPPPRLYAASGFPSATGPVRGWEGGKQL